MIEFIKHEHYLVILLVDGVIFQDSIYLNKLNYFFYYYHNILMFDYTHYIYGAVPNKDA